ERRRAVPLPGSFGPRGRVIGVRFRQVFEVAWGLLRLDLCVSLPARFLDGLSEVRLRSTGDLLCPLGCAFRNIRRSKVALRESLHDPLAANAEHPTDGKPPKKEFHHASPERSGSSYATTQPGEVAAEPAPSAAGLRVTAQARCICRAGPSKCCDAVPSIGTRRSRIIKGRYGVGKSSVKPGLTMAMPGPSQHR